MVKSKKILKTQKVAKQRSQASKTKSKVARRPNSKTSATDDKALRKQLLNLLGGGGAHVGFEAAIADIPPALRGVKPPGLPFTAWTLLEHMRIAQWDILEFSRNPKHVSPPWPAGYWPAADGPPDEAAWNASVKAFRAGIAGMQKLAGSPASDLFTPFPHGNGQTLYREALLVADHNAYHLGQLVMLRRLLGVWSGG